MLGWKLQSRPRPSFHFENCKPTEFAKKPFFCVPKKGRKEVDTSTSFSDCRLYIMIVHYQYAPTPCLFLISLSELTLETAPGSSSGSCRTMLPQVQVLFLSAPAIGQCSWYIQVYPRYERGACGGDWCASLRLSRHTGCTELLQPYGHATAVL